MIIECINCNKKFDVNSDLIPSTGRTIQCGSCNFVWFFNPSADAFTQNSETGIAKKTIIQKNEVNYEKKIRKPPPKIKKQSQKSLNLNNKKNYEIAPYKSKSIFSLSKFLSYIIVLIITFIAVIIVIDTFKSPIYSMFPNTEYLIFSLFEVLKDIELFIKDLI